MNITILTNRDLASHIALGRLVKLLGNHSLTIFMSEKVGKAHSLPDPLMALAAFEKDLITTSRYSFDDIAAQAGCELQGFADIDSQVNGPKGIARLQATAPDLILSIRFGLIIRDDIIALPKHGIMNLHSGVLPQYRGVMATYRAMVNGDKEIGSTLHFISDRGIDTGGILSVAKIPLNSQHSYLLNVLKLYTAGCEQIVDAVKLLDAGVKLLAKPQQGEPRYYSFPSDTEVEQFLASDHRLFDSSETDAIKQLQC